MIKCSYCARPAVYTNKVSNTSLCKQHFLEYFERKVRRTVRKYNMIEPEDRLIVGVSGGKDSMALLHLLLKLKRKMRKLEVIAVLVDEGISGYREKTVQNLVNYAKAHDVKYTIASFRDYVGASLDEMVKVSSEARLPYMPCSYCGVFRRYVLNMVAREMGATAIATAHNIDDVVQTYLMNLINNNWDRVFSLSPVRVSSEKFIVKRIKPFYEVLERESALYALLNGLVPLEYVQCPYVKYNVRFVIRRMLNELEDRYPGSKYGLLRSLLELINLNNKLQLAKRSYTRCIVCGNPSSHSVCKACLFRAKLKLLSPELEKLVLDAAKNDSSIAHMFYE